MFKNKSLSKEKWWGPGLWALLIMIGFIFSHVNAADLIDVLPVTNRIIILQFDEGHVDYNGIEAGGNYKTGPFEGQGDNVNYYSALNQSAASNNSNYRIISPDDPNYSAARNPQHIGIKRKGQDFTYNTFIAHDYKIYLKLPYQLVSGKTYTIELLNGLAENTTVHTFVFDPFSILSPTIHVNQVGYRPDQPKYAYLSQWMGTYNSSPDTDGALDLTGYTGKSFYIFNIETNTIVRTYNTSITLQRSEATGAGNYNWTHADVYQCDFTDFTTPGKYILVVEDMGCSYPFEIADDIYRKSFYTAMRGLYYQRSGVVKIADEFGGKLYPRDHHADDGTKIYYDPSSTNMDANYDTYNFDENRRIDGVLKFTGHYHDAGDWDYYNRHNIVPLTLMLLYDLKPGNFSDNDLNNKIRYSETSSTINESGNGIPDLLDEAAWMVHMYKRVKDAIKTKGGTGGVPGWIGPDAGATDNPSWADTRNVGIKAEMPTPTFAYAANAAYYSHVLSKAKSLGYSAIQQSEIDMWKQEAIDAWNWADSRYSGDAREKMLAAVALYLVTGNATYQSSFKTQFQNDNTTGWPSWDAPRPYVIATGIYLNSCADKSNLDQTFFDNVRNNIIDRANSVTDNSFNFDYRFGGLTNNQTNMQSLITTPRTIYMALAYEATGQQKYLDAMYNTTSYTLGGNQENEVRMGGIGDKAEESAFKPDFWYLFDYNSMVYRNPLAVGIPVYSAVWSWWNFFDFGSDKHARRTTIPEIVNEYNQGDDTWPRGELRMNNRYSIEGSEFTINENCTWNIFAYGYLTSNNSSGFTPNQPPVVSINLGEGQDFNADGCQLNVNASTDTRIIKYYYDWHYIGESSDADNNFEIFWNPPLSSGSVLITAVAYDDEGLQSLPSDMADANINIVPSAPCGGPFLSVSPSTLELPATGGTATINVSSNVSNWSVLENISWLSVNSVNGSENGSFVVDVESYTVTTSDRSGIITVSGDGLSRDIQVTQNAVQLDVSISGLNPSNYQVSELQNGVVYYIDRNFVVNNAPEGLTGEKFIKTANSDKSVTGTNFLNFEIDKKCDIFVAFDQRSSVPSWLNSWEQQTETITVSDADMGYFNLYKSTFDPGQVSLGDNGGAGSMYIVIVKPMPGDTQPTYTLNINAGLGGSVAASPDQTVFTEGAGVTITATANQGYQFAGWIGDAAGTTNPLTITMDANKSLSASFSLIQTGEWNEDFTGLSNGTTSDNGSTEWSVIYDGLGAFEVQNGEIIAQGLGDEAVWQSEVIDISGSSDISVDIRSDGGLETWQDYIEVLYKLDGGAETQISKQQGTFNNNNVQTVSVTDLSGTTVQVIIRVKNTGTDEFYYFDNVIVTGVGTNPDPTYSLTTFANNGSISINPDQAEYEEGTTVTLTAVPNSGYQFDGWSGDVSGSTNPLTVTMNSDKSVSANFSQVQQEELLITNINRSGYEVADLVIGTRYYSDRDYTVTSLPSILNGEKFIRTPNNDKSATGTNFLTFNINLEADIYIAYDNRSSAPIWMNGWTLQSGSIDVNDGYVGYFDVYKQTYDAGQVILGDNGGAGTMYFVIVVPTGGGTIPENYALNINSGTGGSVSVSPDQTQYSNGTQVTLTAIPDQGYQFDGWSGDDTGSENPIVITMDSDKSIGAAFSQMQQTEDWIENFTGLSNGTSSDNGSTAWSVSYSGAGAFNVQSEILTAQGLGGEAIWQSEQIAIQGATDFSLSIRSSGPMESHQDYIRVYYRIDGGTEVLVNERVGNFNSNNFESITATNLSGSNLQIIVKMYNSGSDEYYYLDNVSVSAADGGSDEPLANFRIIVSTDIGGSDPDDFQSMVHLFVYLDVLDVEGLVASPPNGGRDVDILEVIDSYENDYNKLLSYSSEYPTPNFLRGITKQGAINPQSGSTPPSTISAGAQLIIDRAKVADDRPLYVLVWGSITDVAQAVHKDPTIKNKIRVYSIGAWNTQQDQNSRNYLYNNHSDMWWIENNTTFRGMYIGGNQSGEYGNYTFVSQNVENHGSLGDLFYAKKNNIKMGDTPSVLYMLNGDPADPLSDSWGGRFRTTSHGPNYWTDRTESTLEENGYDGAKTVNIWRTDYLDDWKNRMDRAQALKSALIEQFSDGNTDSNPVFTIYPNPSFTGEVRIHVEEEVSIQVIDLTGRIVHTSKTAEQIILNDLANGTYIIRAAQGNKVLFEKLIVQK